PVQNRKLCWLWKPRPAVAVDERIKVERDRSLAERIDGVRRIIIHERIQVRTALLLDGVSAWPTPGGRVVVSEAVIIQLADRIQRLGAEAVGVGRRIRSARGHVVAESVILVVRSDRTGR